LLAGDNFLHMIIKALGKKLKGFGIA